MTRGRNLTGIAVLTALSSNALPALAQVEEDRQDDNGFTLNAGAGLKYFATDRVLLRLEARYRYLDGVLDRFDDSLNTVATTLGVGWTF